jgi:hypothetical protein
MKSEIHVGTKEITPFAGVTALLAGVAVCGKARRMRDGQQQVWSLFRDGLFLC